MADSFLRIPPFPDHRAQPLASGPAAEALAEPQTEELIGWLRLERVGGDFWAPQPHLPAGRDILLAPTSPAEAREMTHVAREKGVEGRCFLFAGEGWPAGSSASGFPVVHGPIDPWHLANRAVEIWGPADQDVALAAAVLGTPVKNQAGVDSGTDLAELIHRRIGAFVYRSPFDGRPINALEAAKLLTEWRKLIDSNRDIAAVLGIAAWKRSTVDGLLWNGAAVPRYVRRLPEGLGTKDCVALWASRISPATLKEVASTQASVAEVEDGMIRGPGLGANCVPPLSLVVDRSGIYFDPSKPSDLESILESAEMDAPLLERAARLRRRVTELGVSKYGSGHGMAPVKRRGRHVLVVGQVEDDRSIMSGGGGQTNLQLLERARQLEPEAWLIYRPHPDVEAGHRKGHVPDNAALRFADQVERGGSITDLIEAVDEVHCITSLAGFEALLRGKAVTAHGVPFYAGWGLTRDLAPVPARRSRRRSVDELIAATLILYPRYIDPVTRLPSPPEILIERIARGEAHVDAPLAGIRSLQGKLNLAIRRIREAVA